MPTEVLLISSDGKRLALPRDMACAHVDDSALPAGFHAMNCSRFFHRNGIVVSEEQLIDERLALKSVSPDAEQRIPRHVAPRSVDDTMTAAMQLRILQAQAALRGEMPDVYPIVTARSEARGIAIGDAALEILDAAYAEVEAAEIAAEHGGER
ncbi:hypothetical protein [Trinickia acidisoli]|uniref:hypothetical protein n=1 Tax=Trinickia acidisoli TaxID=2767482 RepID=UPI001A8CCCD7|nr:hypothetical protein [Trinickia acidisoli]